MKGRKRMKLALLIIVAVAVVAGAIAVYPMVRRWIENRDLVWLGESADWKQVGELRGGAQDVTVRFQYTEGPLELELRPEHLIDGEWTQGEAFTLHLAEEKLCSLPEAQQHRYMARAIRLPDDDRQYINGEVRVLLTPAE